jgi:hypothetical protein
VGEEAEAMREAAADDPSLTYTLTLEEAVDQAVDALVAYTVGVEEGGIRSAAVRDAVAARAADQEEEEEEATPSPGSRTDATEQQIAAAERGASRQVRRHPHDAWYTRLDSWRTTHRTPA